MGKLVSFIRKNQQGCVLARKKVFCRCYRDRREDFADKIFVKLALCRQKGASFLRTIFICTERTCCKMENAVEAINSVIVFINDNILWGIPMILMIIGTGVFLTFKSKFFQIRKFGDSIKSTIVPTVKSVFKGDKKAKNRKEKSISQFEAFSAAISGTVGTGNIVGVAGALISGGPGAIFWMWVSALFGLFTNYSENVLGLYFRKKGEDGSFSGGPMYYLEKGTKSRSLAMIYSICCMLAAIGMSMVQVNSISGTIQNLVSPEDGKSIVAAIITGVITAAVTAAIIIGGIKKIGKVASMIVPFMALLFILLSFVVIGSNIGAVPHAFGLIFSNAFSFKSVGGGLLGYTIMVGMRYGCARGVFSNEAGLGSSVIAHSASEVREPVKQGLWGIFEVFFDTFIICTLTALSLITTGLYDFTDIAQNAGVLNKSQVASSAMAGTFGVFGTVIYSIILPLFAFTTILAWSYYGQKATEYVFAKHSKAASVAFRVIYVILIAVGAVTASNFVWNLDDTFNAAMAIPNLIGLISLSGLIIKITKNYYDRKEGKKVKPLLSAYDDLNEEFIDDINNGIGI